MSSTILHGNCSSLLDPVAAARREIGEFDLTFLDPPFNQNKEYERHDDNLPHDEYWGWTKSVCRSAYDLTAAGGALYFMQREKNIGHVMRVVREAGWTYQNLIVWKKLTSAVPGSYRFGKSHQVIVFATKGTRPRVFNRLRIDPPLLAHHKYERPNGMYVTDVWDDIRELTAGYFAGDEPLREAGGDRLHKQQAPIKLLLRIVLSSTMPGDRVLDPFAGTGTTLAVCDQLARECVGIEIDERNVAAIRRRLSERRAADDIIKALDAYSCTPELAAISGRAATPAAETPLAAERERQMPLVVSTAE